MRLLLFLGFCFELLKYTVTSKRPNVLFLMADDMRPNVGFLHGDRLNGFTSPRIYTPNIDDLASRSLVLKQAFVQQAICAPSRTSLLTGRRPDTTHVYGFTRYWRKSGGNFTTIPQYFKDNGYITVGMGKIFHSGKSSNDNDPISWSEPYYDGDYNFENKFKSWEAIPDKKLHNKQLVDEQVADEAIKRLKKFSAASTYNNYKPFFLAVGFHKPHLPFVFPKSMLEKYPMRDIKVPRNAYAPINMPKVAGRDNHIFHAYSDLRIMNISDSVDATVPDLVVRQLRRAYYCAISWADFQLGRVLGELDNLGLSGNTIIAFLSDHGYTLGEHNLWTKFTNFELALRALLMVHIPGVTNEMVHTEEIVEFVDIFPTLVEAAGLNQLPLCPKLSSNVRLCREGASFMPLIASPDTPIKSGAFSQATRPGNVMGYSVRTSRFRYTKWVRFNHAKYKPIWNECVGEELYDHSLDNEENNNVAMKPEYKEVKIELQELLQNGWRASRYSEGAATATGSLTDDRFSGPEFQEELPTWFLIFVYFIVIVSLFGFTRSMGMFKKMFSDIKVLAANKGGGLFTPNCQSS